MTISMGVITIRRYRYTLLNTAFVRVGPRFARIIMRCRTLSEKVKAYVPICGQDWWPSHTLLRLPLESQKGIYHSHHIAIPPLCDGSPLLAFTLLLRITVIFHRKDLSDDERSLSYERSKWWMWSREGNVAICVYYCMEVSATFANDFLKST